MVYDALDRLTKTTYDDGHWTEYAYDEDGDRLSVTDKPSTGNLIRSETYTYDAMNRPSTDLPSGGSTHTFTWDGNSRLLTFADSSGTLTYGYDDDGSLTSMAQPGGSCAGYDTSTPPTVASQSTVFGVDKNGARTLVIYPGNLARQTWA